MDKLCSPGVCLFSSWLLIECCAPALGCAGSSDVCSLSFVLFAQHCFPRGVRSWDGSCCFAIRKAGRTILPGSSPCNPPWTLWAPWNPPSLTGESGPSLQQCGLDGVLCDTSVTWSACHHWWGQWHYFMHCSALGQQGICSYSEH